MAQGTTKENLSRAIDLIKNGNKKEGGKILLDLVEAEPQNEDAWLWLSLCFKDTEKKISCINKVLAINPNNEKAKLANEEIIKIINTIEPGEVELNKKISTRKFNNDIVEINNELSKFEEMKFSWIPPRWSEVIPDYTYNNSNNRQKYCGYIKDRWWIKESNELIKELWPYLKKGWTPKIDDSRLGIAKNIKFQISRRFHYNKPEEPMIPADIWWIILFAIILSYGFALLILILMYIFRFFSNIQNNYLMEPFEFSITLIKHKEDINGKDYYWLEGKNEFVFSQPQKYFNKYIFPGYGLLALSRENDPETGYFIWNGTDISKRQIEDGFTYSDRIMSTGFYPIRNGIISRKNENFEYSN